MSTLKWKSYKWGRQNNNENLEVTSTSCVFAGPSDNVYIYAKENKYE